MHWHCAIIELTHRCHIAQTRMSSKVEAFVIDKAQEYLGQCQVYFFGSRATGTYARASDYDFAFSFTASAGRWAAFVADVQEDAPTLVDIDLVNLNHADEKLRANIIETGKLIYGHTRPWFCF